MKRIEKLASELLHIEQEAADALSKVDWSSMFGSDEKALEHSPDLRSNDYLLRHSQLFSQVEKLRKELKVAIADEPAIAVQDPEAHDLVKSLAAELDAEASGIDWIYSDNEEDPDGILIDSERDLFDLHNRLSPYSMVDFLKGLFETRPLVLRHPVPRHLASLIREARYCHAFGQSQAVTSLCRTILETAITDIAATIGKIPPPKSTREYFKQYPPSDRIAAVSSGRLRNRIWAVYITGSASIHGEENSAGFGIIQETLAILNNLYCRHYKKYTKAKNPDAS